MTQGTSAEMAGCLQKMQTDDNKLDLQSNVTQLQAVNIKISALCPLAAADIRVVTAACKE